MVSKSIQEILELQDKLRELQFMANTAHTYARNITGEENHPEHGNYIKPEDWINNELRPFFWTAHYRLTEIHDMVHDFLEKHLSTLELSDEADEPEPEGDAA